MSGKMRLVPGDLSYSQEEAFLYVGLTEAEAVASATSAGIQEIRVVKPGQGVSADYRFNRLRLKVVNGLVTRAWFG